MTRLASSFLVTDTECVLIYEHLVLASKVTEPLSLDMLSLLHS